MTEEEEETAEDGPRRSEPQTLDQIRAALRAALPLRVPIWNPRTNAREKVDALESYLAECAYTRADCEEALYWTWEAEKVLRREWEGIQGWEALLPSKARAKPTEAQVTRAKARVKPEVFDGLSEVKRLIEGLDRQCKRLTRDEETCSRRYSLLAGG